MYTKLFNESDFQSMASNDNVSEYFAARNCHSFVVANMSPYFLQATDTSGNVLAIIPPYSNVVDNITQGTERVYITFSPGYPQSSITADAYAVYAGGIHRTLDPRVDTYAL